MAELFGVRTPAVNKHLKNIFATGELVEDSVVSKMETTAALKKVFSDSELAEDSVIRNFRITATTKPQLISYFSHRSLS